MPDFLRSLAYQHAFLFWTTVYTALLFWPSLALLAGDQRLVAAANPWIKVLKFEISIVAFNITMGWLLLRLGLPPGVARLLGWVMAMAMFVEINAIALQALRGVPSHYNMSTPLNAAIFTSMAVAIVANTLALMALAVFSFAPQPQLPPAVTWGVRWGLILLLMTSVQGFQIVGHRGHTVGAAPGGPGLPFLGWSTIAGDLRVAHFAGMHGIQVLPLVGYFVSRFDRQAGTPIVTAAFLLIAAFFLWSLRQALAGRPLLR